MVVRHVIFNMRAQHKNPTHDAPFSFPAEPSPPRSFPAIAGHFSLEPSPLKPDNAHLTFVMSHSLLHIVFPHGPPRSPPPTAPLSALILSPVFVLIHHRHKGEEVCAAHDASRTKKAVLMSLEPRFFLMFVVASRASLLVTLFYF